MRENYPWIRPTGETTLKKTRHRSVRPVFFNTTVVWKSERPHQPFHHFDTAIFLSNDTHAHTDTHIRKTLYIGQSEYISKCSPVLVFLVSTVCDIISVVLQVNTIV
jgi:hypothetical protein